MKKIAVYPGSFDPPTNGHIDIVKRASKLFDEVIVIVGFNPEKEGKYLFDSRQRVYMWDTIIRDMQLSSLVTCVAWNGLTIDLAKKWNSVAIIRGLRAVSDFESEFQLALMNKKIDRDIQTIFLMSSLQWSYTSSTIVKEGMKFGVYVSDMVHPFVHECLLEKLEKR